MKAHHAGQLVMVCAEGSGMQPVQQKLALASTAKLEDLQLETSTPQGFRRPVTRSWRCEPARGCWQDAAFPQSTNGHAGTSS